VRSSNVRDFHEFSSLILPTNHSNSSSTKTKFLFPPNRLRRDHKSNRFYCFRCACSHSFRLISHELSAENLNFETLFYVFPKHQSFKEFFLLNRLRLLESPRYFHHIFSPLLVQLKRNFRTNNSSFTINSLFLARR
jgi:hypothetical protein